MPPHPTKPTLTAILSQLLRSPGGDRLVARATPARPLRALRLRKSGPGSSPLAGDVLRVPATEPASCGLRRRSRLGRPGKPTDGQEATQQAPSCSGGSAWWRPKGLEGHHTSEVPDGGHGSASSAGRADSGGGPAGRARFPRIVLKTSAAMLRTSGSELQRASSRRGITVGPAIRASAQTASRRTSTSGSRSASRRSATTAPPPVRPSVQTAS